MAKPDWSSGDLDMLKQIVDESQTYIQGQVSLATSADQRASVLGGIYVAAATAVVAGLIAAAAPTGGTVTAGVVAAAMFLVGASLCIWTVLPAGIYLPGSAPENWYLDLGRDYKSALGEEAENSQDKIEDNSRLLSRNAKVFTAGAFLGIAAPFVGGLLWLFLRGFA